MRAWAERRWSAHCRYRRLDRPRTVAQPAVLDGGGTPMVPPPAVAAGMPPVPLGNMTGQGFGPAVLQYGFRPSFVARPPAAG